MKRKPAKQAKKKVIRGSIPGKPPVIRKKSPSGTKRLEASNEHLNHIINSLGDPVFVKNRDHTWVLLNDAYCEFMGYRREELIGKSDYDFFPREEAKVFWDKDESVFDSGIPNINEEKFTDSKGITHIILTKKVLYNLEGDEDYLVGVITDITRLKEKEEEILFRKTLLESVNEEAMNGILMLDTRGEVIVYNKSFTDIWGIPESVLDTRSYNKYQQEIVEKLVEPSDFLAKVAGLTDDIEAKARDEFLLKDGKIVEWYTTPINGPETLYGRVWYYHDVTESKKAGEELKKAKESAESANRTKSAFLANMSHELRTPLNAIIGFINVLKEETFGKLNEKQMEFLGYVTDSSKHLLSLINDVLDLSKIESGKVALDLTEFDVRDLLNGSLMLIRDRAEKRNIEIVTEIPTDLGTVIADERRVRQVVLNLLSNAVKFVHDGGKVGLKASVSGGELTVAVWDNGIGIDPEDVGRIFKEFEQIDSSYSRKYGGTGLGLAISKKLIELHGGRIWFESEGKEMGTVFSFVIPQSHKK
jgi:PAS domain S-box-containing protein